MRIPDSLASLVDHGILEEVLRPLMSGKEAQVFLVVSNGEERVAKVYKEAQNRTFKNRAEYTEGRRVRSSRDQRAMEKRSRYGRAQDEAAWRSAEVDMIYRLAAAGVRVPKPYHFIDGVLIMELVKDAEGIPAPRLGDLVFTPEQASGVFQQLISETARMLCAGVVHGDLSDFNVLMGVDGPVIIDFPQAVNASGNQNARRILVRDVANLQRFLARHMPQGQPMHYAEEMWALYERNALTPDTKLTGRFRGATKVVTTEAVMSLVKDAEYDERKRREGLGISMRGVPRETRPGGDSQRGPGPQRDRGGAQAQRPALERGPIVQQRAPRTGSFGAAPQPEPARERPPATHEARAGSFGSHDRPRHERPAANRAVSEQDQRRFRQQDPRGRAAEPGPNDLRQRDTSPQRDAPPQRAAPAQHAPQQRQSQQHRGAPHERDAGQPRPARGAARLDQPEGAHDQPRAPHAAAAAPGEGAAQKKRRRRRRGRKPADGAPKPSPQ